MSVVPFVDKFTSLHRADRQKQFAEHYKNFVDMEGVEPQLMNFFLIFGFCQQDIFPMFVNDKLYPFVTYLRSCFNQTLFGLVYYQNKDSVQTILQDFEEYLYRTKDPEVKIFQVFRQKAQLLDHLIDSTLGTIVMDLPDLDLLFTQGSQPSEEYNKFLYKSKCVTDIRVKQ